MKMRDFIIDRGLWHEFTLAQWNDRNQRQKKGYDADIVNRRKVAQKSARKRYWEKKAPKAQKDGLQDWERDYLKPNKT